MVELKCILVFGLICVVSATPHGYGVKGGYGGAAAKAEASASAGAFGGIGDIPFAAPNGAGYSGSFSKSSSSSFASSSASSSASAFSFSGAGPVGLSGSKATGSDVHGISEGSNRGCTTGACTSGSNGLYSGSGATAAANAGAAAGSEGYSKNKDQASCTGGSCGDVKPDCTGADCADKSNDNSNCQYGQCGSTENDNNDIHVNTDGASKSIYGTNDKNAFDKSGGNNLPSTNCAYGNCDQAKKPHYGGESGAPASHKPASYLTTPKKDAPCTSANCDSSNDNAYPESNLPSSYNVPIHGSIPSTSCTSGNCGNEQPSTFTPGYQGPSNYFNNQNKGTGCLTPNCAAGISGNSKPTNYHPNYQGPTGSSNTSPGVFEAPKNSPGLTGHASCTSGNCAGYPSQPTTGTTGSITANYPQFGHNPSNGSPTTKCTTPDCAGHHFAAAGSTATTFPGSQLSPKPNPGGLLNSYSGPKNSDHSYKPYNPTTTADSLGCSTGHCINGKPGVSKEAVSDHQTPPKSSGPPYTGGFGGPPGILNTERESSSPNRGTGAPNCASGKCPDHVPSYSHSSSRPTGSGSCAGTSCHGRLPTGPGKEPNYSQNSYGSNGCTTGNCGNYPGNTASPYDASKPGYPFFNTGATAGTLNPNTGTHIPDHTQGSYKPPGAAWSQDCATGYCSGGPAGHTPPSSGAYRPNYSTGTYNPAKVTPTTGFATTCKTPNCATYPYSEPSPPAYTGGFDSSSGTSNVNTGSQIPGQSQGSYTPANPIGSQNCASGYCSSNPSGNVPTGFDQKQPNYSSGTYSPSGAAPTATSTTCKTANCAAYPSSDAGATAGDVYGTQNLSKPSTPAYTGGFGSPSGSINNAQNLEHSQGPIGSQDCANGHCSSRPASQIPAGTGTIYPSGTYNPNGAPNSESAVDTGSQTSSKPDNDKHPYTGSFGGPAGILKPNEYSIPANTPTSAYTKPTTPSSHNTAPCSSGNCNTQPTSPGSGSSSTAHAAASANAVAYTGGFGGPPGFLKPNDSGKDHDDKLSPGSHSGGHGTAPNSGNNSPFGNSLSGAQAGTGAQASASAGASAGTYSGGDHGSHNGASPNNNQGGGCGGGCGSGTNGSNGLNIAGAAAKSHAAAVGSGSFASSSASAHAFAGAGVKGGYGR